MGFCLRVRDWHAHMKNLRIRMNVCTEKCLSYNNNKNVHVPKMQHNTLMSFCPFFLLSFCPFVLLSFCPFVLSFVHLSICRFVLSSSLSSLSSLPCKGLKNVMGLLNILFLDIHRSKRLHLKIHLYLSNV